MKRQLGSSSLAVGKPPTPPAAVSKTVPVVSVVPIPVVDTRFVNIVAFTQIRVPARLATNCTRVTLAFKSKSRSSSPFDVIWRV